MRYWRMAGLLAVLVMVSSVRVAAQALGVEQPMQEVGTEVWGTVIPVALGLTSAVLILIGILMHHTGVFISIVMVLVVIYAIGFGIPTAITNAGLQWFF